MSIRIVAVLLCSALALQGMQAAAGVQSDVQSGVQQSDPSVGTPLTDDQVAAISQQILARMDQNHDGRLSRAEIAAYDLRSGRTMFNQKHWKEADANHDGYLSTDEISAVVKRTSVEGRKASAGH